MNKPNISIFMVLLVMVAAMTMVSAPGWAATPMPNPGGIPDYFNTPNWANSPPLRKFIDDLAPLGCTTTTATLGQCIPIAVPDTTTYPGSDYYEIELVEYRERMHSDLPALNNPDKMAATSGGTLLRGYRQVNTADPNLLTPHYLGPLIIATKYDPTKPAGVAGNGKPVRVKFINSLPTGAGGNLFIPVDTTIMGSGPFVIDDPNNPGLTISGNFSQNRATLHLHGGRTPWISDGTPHQWITPAGEPTAYPVGMSVANVPDMMPVVPGAAAVAQAYAASMVTAATNFKAAVDGTPGTPAEQTAATDILAAANNAKTLADAAVAAPDSATHYAALNAFNELKSLVIASSFPTVAPATVEAFKLSVSSTATAVAFAMNAAGSQTFFWTNEQSSRMMFYHDHAWGITRLNVYAGEAAGYLIQDQTEQELVTAGVIPSDQIPLIIQDKTFVDETTLVTTDPTWNWGSIPGSAVTGDLWWPHVYMPAQNPYNPDGSGVAAFGRWHYGPWFWPPTNGVPFGPVPNHLYNPDCIPSVQGFCQPPMMPGTPNPSWGAEAFMDTPVINGTAYPKLTVQPKAYRLRVLNAAHDRFWNLQFYEADSTVPPGCPTCVPNSEVKMVPAIPRPLCSAVIITDCVCDGAFTPAGCFPPTWPTDSREGGVPDPALAGPSFIQIGTEGGFLPQPVVLPNQPVNWNTDVTTFNAGNVLNWADGGGTLMLGPAERADVIVDFSQYAGKTLILYNDAPAPWPALDPHYDYYTGAPDRTDMGGSPGTPVGKGPNVRTIMQIHVASAPPAAAYDLAALQAAFTSTPGYDSVFKRGQEDVIVGQSAYDSAYNITFPATYPSWGIARISDTTLSFNTPDSTVVKNYPIIKKAIQDEMGETFDDYGRMSAKLGITSEAAARGFVVQNFVDPPTEMITNGEVQIWKITHNGVDTHPIHFHLFEVQVLNRVGWDGFIRYPDANELGWKDTVRISPLEDTIVAVRATVPTVPFALPDSVRPLNPEKPIGSTEGFSNLDPITGNAIAPPVNNQMFNFKNEYVWHCHILSHEENDMMRSIVLQLPTAVPDAPSGLTAALVPPVAPATVSNTIKLDWTDNSNIAPNTETGFRIERCAGAGCSVFVAIASVFPNVTTYTDGTVLPLTDYTYRVIAVNTAGDSLPSNTATVSTPDWSTATGVSISSSALSPHIAGTEVVFAASATPAATVVYEFRFWLNGVIVRDYSTASTLTLPASALPGTYTITVDARSSGASATPEATDTLVYNIIGVPDAPTNVAATPGNTQATITFSAPLNTGNSPILSYTVISNPPGGLTNTGPGSPITVTGLTNGVAYTFTVTATNAAGTGPASLPSNSVTPATLPGPPTIGTAVAGDASASVSFAAPASDGGSPIISYTVTSTPGNITATGTASPITVTGLTVGISYTFNVRATNAIGTGPASGESNSILPCGYIVSPLTIPLSAYSDFANITVTTDAGCTWTASSPAAWLTIAPVNGNGSGTVKVFASANSTAARSSSVTVSSPVGVVATVAVNQAAYKLEASFVGIIGGVAQENPFGPPPLDITFDASGSKGSNPITNYHWDFGDGSPAVDTAVTTVPHSYALTGSYTVTLTVGDGVQTGTTQRLVTVADAVHNVSTAAELQTALTTAQGNGMHDLIRIAGGTYNLSANVNNHFSYIAAAGENRDLVIEGGWTPDFTMRAYNILSKINNDLAGASAVDGGVLYLDGSTNATSGGINVDGLSITGGNTTGAGGGIYAKAGGSVMLSNNIIQGNIGGEGGGAYAESTAKNLWINGNAFRGNTGTKGGGASIKATGASTSAFIYVNEVSGNSAATDAGFSLQSAASSQLIVSNNSIFGNTTTLGSAGLTTDNIGAAGTSVIDIHNNIIFGNTGGADLLVVPDCTYLINYLDLNVISNDLGSYAICLDYQIAPSNITLSPYFVTNATGDVKLRATDTGLIDKGSNQFIPAEDFEGDLVPLDGGSGQAIADIGADEYNPLLPNGPLSMTVTSSSPTITTAGGSVTLTVTLDNPAKRDMVLYVTHVDTSSAGPGQLLVTATPLYLRILKGSATGTVTVQALLNAGYGSAVITLTDPSGKIPPVNTTVTLKPITVTSPNGGESWAQGTAHQITWTYTGDPGANVRIELFKASPASTVLIAASVPKGTNGSGSYNWAVPTSILPGSDYTVWVSSATMVGAQDASDLPFSVVAPAFTLGDVNADTNVNIVDALFIARYSAGLSVGPIFIAAAADVNCDFMISIVDSLFVAQRSAGLSVPGWCP